MEKRIRRLEEERRVAEQRLRSAEKQFERGSIQGGDLEAVWAAQEEVTRIQRELALARNQEVAVRID